MKMRVNLMRTEAAVPVVGVPVVEVPVVEVFIAVAVLAALVALAALVVSVALTALGVIIVSAVGVNHFFQTFSDVKIKKCPCKLQGHCFFGFIRDK